MALTCKFAADADFFGALQQVGSDAGLANARFPARNFLLECEAPDSRVGPYLARAGVPRSGLPAVGLVAQINASHARYLEDEVRLGVRSQPFTQGHRDCPATFRTGCTTTEFAATGGELELVRVEELSFVATYAGMDLSRARALLERVSRKNRVSQAISPDDRDELAALLDAWQDRVDARPLFAAFWEDAHDVVADWSAPGWADLVRDRLGLAHLDPTGRGDIEVVLFKYRVSQVPQDSQGRRLLLRPTVLDTTLNEAFFTGEPSSGVGSTVDLVVRDDTPWQEVLHPAIRLRPQHVWSVDTVTAPVPMSLAAAREHHAVKSCLAATDAFAALIAEVEGL